MLVEQEHPQLLQRGVLSCVPLIELVKVVKKRDEMIITCEKKQKVKEGGIKRGVKGKENIHGDVFSVGRRSIYC